MSSLWLKEHRHNVTSQNGEDGVIDAIFKKIGAANKWCCEFGAWDGKTISNTYDLIMNQGWSAVLIEAEAERFKQLQNNFREINRAVLMQEFVRPSNIEEILNKTPLPKDLDLLSIDVDNDDYLIWQTLENYRPRVVVIEVNTSYGPEMRKIPELGKPAGRDAAASFASMVDLAKLKGYELACHIGNTIFVLKELGEQLGVDPANWKDLYTEDSVINCGY
jgi:hypothetical protein